MKTEIKKIDFLGENALLFYFAAFKFLLLIILAGNYGFFRDEYYYIECSKNLAFGFVDQPPLSALILFLTRQIFGESLLAVRLTAYFAGSATIFIAGLLAREMNGGKFAQGLAALAALFSGVLLGTSGYFSMNAFDTFFAALFFLLLLRLINTQNKKYLILIGVVFGLGLQNKYTLLFVAAGLFVGFLLTANRKFFLAKELWIGAGIAAVIVLPHVLWQIGNDFPTLEFMRNAAMYKNQPMGFAEFAFNSLLELNPASIILLITALYFLAFNSSGRKYSVIGIIFISVFLIFLFNNGKPYYMGVLYPAIIAAGAVGADLIISKLNKKWLRYALIITLLPLYILVTPFAIPVLDVDTFIEYSEFTGVKSSGASERSALGVLPQFFADRFGWEEMAQKVAEVYNTLTPEEKKVTLIAGQNYGEAGAIDYYREKYGLPKAISPHNNYWLWGYPDWYKGEILIVIGSTLEDNKELFEQVELAASHYNKYGMPYENVDIFICRKIKMPLKEIWNRIKIFI